MFNALNSFGLMRRLFLTLILPCIGMMGGNMPVVCAKKTQPAALYTQFQTAKCDQRVASETSGKEV